MQKNTIVCSLVGIELDTTLQEIWIGPARVYLNPVLVANPSSWQDQIPGGGFVLLYKGEGPISFPTPVVKFHFDVEFETKKLRMPHPLPHAHAALTKGLLPLLLGTKGDILRGETIIGIGTRDEVVSNAAWATPDGAGIDASLLRRHTRTVKIDKADCEKLQELSQKIHSVSLDTFNIPISIFVNSYYRVNPADRGIDLLTALESLLSEGSESIAMKVSLRAACLLEKEGEKRKRIYGIVKESYQHRNSLVHGSKKRPAAAEWFRNNGDDLEDIVRKTLYLIVELLAQGIELIPEKVDEHLFDSGLLDTNAVIPTCEDIGSLIHLPPCPTIVL